ncbi:MAG: hypothetical protein AAF721_07200 [Myxococcota bacterium]
MSTLTLAACSDPTASRPFGAGFGGPDVAETGGSSEGGDSSTSDGDSSDTDASSDEGHVSGDHGGTTGMSGTGSTSVMGATGGSGDAAAGSSSDGIGGTDGEPEPDTALIDANWEPLDVIVVTEDDAVFPLESDEGVAFECRLDAGAWQPCGPNIQFEADPGVYTLEARAIAEAGTVDPSPAQATLVVGHLFEPNAIATDAVWTTSVPQIIDGTLQIAPDAELSLDGDVVVAGPLTTNPDPDQGHVQVFGRLSANSVGAPVRFFGLSLEVGAPLLPADPAFIDLQGVEINGGSLYPPIGDYVRGGLRLADSVVRDTTEPLYLIYPELDSELSRNVFLDAAPLDVGVDDDHEVVIRNNRYEGAPEAPAIRVFATYAQSQVTIVDNSFLLAGVAVATEGSDASFSVPNNYWGTTDPDEIAARIHDGNDDFSLPLVAFDPPLAAPHPATP